MSSSDQGYIAIDGDGHLHEPEEMFEQYLDPAFRDRASGPVFVKPGVRRYLFDGVAYPPFPEVIPLRKPMAAGDRLKVLDKERIEAAVLYPSAATSAPYLEDVALGQALIRAYNDWVADYVAPTHGRLLYAAPVMLNDIDWAIAEARRAVKMGAIAITIRPNPCMGRTLDDLAYDPFYAAVQDLDVPLVVHETTGDPATAGGDRYGIWNPDRFVFNHAISHSFEQMFASMSIIGGGVLAKFPHLRVAFAEAGCSWVPYWLARLDDHHDNRLVGKQMPIRMKPSEYFERQCMVTCDPFDETLHLAIDGIGAHKIMFATDYPHFDSTGGAVRTFLALPGVSQEDQRRILWDNALDFYRIRLPVTS